MTPTPSITGSYIQQSFGGRESPYISNNNSIRGGGAISHNNSAAFNSVNRIGGGVAVSINPNFDVDINMSPAVPCFND